ncbi:hypothetical protein Ancab_033186 [Ancistrocladus abbreviatus]
MNRAVWIICSGIPLHVLTEEFFKKLVLRWGSFLSVDRGTRQKTRFDMARIAIQTPILDVINTMFTVPNLYGNFFAGEQQPEVVTSPKVVADNSNFKPEKNGLANATPTESKANDGTVPGKSRKDDPSRDAKCKIDGSERFSKSFDERMSKSQGWGVSPKRDSLLFLSGLERLNGGPPSKAQVRILNRAECSAGPEIRPEFMKTT